jgi:tetratricopeptide (TPR) repeat protein
MIGGAALLLLSAIFVGVWQFSAGPDALESLPRDGIDLPIPPVPPRIAEGAEYERCLTQLATDPASAAAFAESWVAVTQKGQALNDGAQHCLALSRIAMGEPLRGAAMLEQLASASTAPTSARASLYGQATQAWLMAGDTAHALGAATMALALSPDDPDLLLERAVAAGGLARFEDALADLSRALELDPRRVDALALRAAARRHLGQLEQAQRDVDRAVALDPDDPDILLERGILRQRRNDRAGARDDWERAISLAPDSPTADLAQQNLALLEAGPERR